MKRLTDHPHRGGFGLKDTDPRVTAAKEHLAKVSADAERIGRRYDERSAAWTTASHVLSNVENSLKDRPGTLADYNGEVPKLAKGETVLDAVERTEGMEERGRPT